jgi:hypothetical protein
MGQPAFRKLGAQAPSLRRATCHGREPTTQKTTDTPYHGTGRAKNQGHHHARSVDRHDAQTQGFALGDGRA